MRLVDHARTYIHDHYRRPWHVRLTRALLAVVLPYPRRFATMAGLARWARPLAPARLPARVATKPAMPQGGKGQVAILRGCAESVLQPQVRVATERLLARMGFGVLDISGEGCCGALVHHLGREEALLAATSTSGGPVPRREDWTLSLSLHLVADR